MRHPEYHPTFTDDDVKTIMETCRRRNAPHTHVQRAQIALCLYRNPGAHSTDVAQEVGVHVETVRKWRKRWAERGFSLDDRPRSGRPRRFSP